jgi:hypothetical protein
VPERSGDFSDLLPGRVIVDPLTRLPFAGNLIPATRLSQPGKVLAPFIPLPNLVQGTTFRAAFSSVLPLGQNLGDARVDARINDHCNMLMARYSVSSSYESSPNPFPRCRRPICTAKRRTTLVRWTKIISPTIQNVAQAALYDSPFIFGAVGPGVNVNGMAGIQGFDNPTVVPEQSWPTIGISGYQGFQGSPSDQRPKYMRIRHLQLSDSINFVHGRHEMKAGMEWLHRNDGFHIGQNSVGNWSFQGAYTGNAFADLLMGIPDSGTRSPVQTLQGDYDDFKAWHFNDTFRVRPGLTVNMGIRWDINPFMKGIRRTRSGVDAIIGKVIVPSGLQNDPTAQPLTGLLLQLFGDRVAFTDDLGLPQSVTPSDHRNVAPRIGVAWTPIQKTVVRAAYGIFFAFPDTNLVNNTVVTVPFVVNSQLFNDRAPAAPTRTFSNFFQGAAIASPIKPPGKPVHSGWSSRPDTPNMTSALVNLREQYTQQWNSMCSARSRRASPSRRLMSAAGRCGYSRGSGATIRRPDRAPYRRVVLIRSGAPSACRNGAERELTTPSRPRSRSATGTG